MRVPVFFCLLVAVGGCVRAGDAPDIEGDWQFAESTLTGFTRSCAPLLFEAAPTFRAERRTTGHIRLAFDDLDGSVLTLRAQSERLVGSMTVLASEIGRMCGSDLRVDVRLRLETAPDGERLVGRWQPTDCSICPGVDLHATRRP